MRSRFGSILLSAALLLAATLPAQAQGEPFFPNDPYFSPGAPGLSPGYFGQWHLINTMPLTPGVNAGLDANILGAWQAGYTGKGIIIGVVDDGVQGEHPELDFHNAYSWDFGADRAENLAATYRGSPVTALNNHGTAVAGVAGAIGGNGVGVSGAAPRAGIASLRYLANYESIESRVMAEVGAILFQGQLGHDGQPDPFAPVDWSYVPVRVKNHSYGSTLAYNRFPGQKLIGDALRQSTANGVIHVISAGNARIQEYDGNWPSNADSNKNNLGSVEGAITVAALGSDGKFSAYSSHGANVFVTAPSSSKSGLYSIATTDRTGIDGYNETEDGGDKYFDAATTGSNEVRSYSSAFGGTSSSAPLVSGIMALGLEANSKLNTRTAQHILVRTSRIVDEGDSTHVGGWVENKAGHQFNRNYGFGLIDATAFVMEASRQGYATEQTFYNSDEVSVQKSFISEGETIRILHDVQIAPEILQPVEFITVSFLITGLTTDIGLYGTGTGDGIGSIQGDFNAWLTSPSGTRQMLFADDRYIPGASVNNRAHREEVLLWDFLSYAYWGEQAEGEWLIELINNTGNELTGVFETYAITIGMGDYVVPEPATYALLLGGGVGIVALLRRRVRS